MSGPMKASQIDVSKITFSAPKTLDNGGKMLYLNYNGGINPIHLVTPEVSIPFDPSYFPDNATSGKYALKISLSNLEDKAMKDFRDKLVELDTLLMNAAVDNSKAWFKKPKLSLETVKELYTPQVKVHTDQETGEPTGKWPDQFGFKVVMKDSKFPNLSVYDNSKVKFDINRETDDPTDINSILMKGSMIKSVLKCNGIWIANGKFGCTWRAEQIRVKVPEGGLKEFAILSDSEDEDDSDPVRPNQEPVVVQKEVENMIEDSSDEEEVPKEPEPVPVEKKVVKKKVRVKKSGE